MSIDRFDLDLTRPAQDGVYFVGVDDLDRLARTAAREELGVCRIDLAGCHDKDALLRRLAFALHLPATFGYNWDALADCLRDLSPEVTVDPEIARRARRSVERMLEVGRN